MRFRDRDTLHLCLCKFCHQITRQNGEGEGDLNGSQGRTRGARMSLRKEIQKCRRLALTGELGCTTAQDVISACMLVAWNVEIGVCISGGDKWSEREEYEFQTSSLKPITRPLFVLFCTWLKSMLYLRTSFLAYPQGRKGHGRTNS